ncbi:MAG TPA: hypothetical protein VE397_17760 [Stellaceae bacterium]|nr:hypothetical protein [Stellaceae bacterium]
MRRAARERREFLKQFGRFAAATPPLITAVLAAPASADDWQSGGHRKCPPFDPFCNKKGWDWW